MTRVSKREFFREPYKYLDKLPLIITCRGEDELILKSVNDEVPQNIVPQKVKPQEKTKVSEVPPKILPKKAINVATKPKVATIPKEIRDFVTTADNYLDITKNPLLKYSCGCAKIEGQNLCKKHGRV